MKFTLSVLSDPKAGEEALGRVFNALAFAAEAHASGDEVAIVFQGTGTRWPAELVKLGHPARELYDAVRPLVAGASTACATVFGATDGVKASGLSLVDENELPGTSGIAGILCHCVETVLG